MIQIEEPISAMGVFLETGSLDDVDVRTSRSEVFSTLEDELRIELKGRYDDMNRIRDDKSIRALRDFFWRIGIDPTKTRPSSEALLRRVLKKGIPSINNLVDSGNLASAKTLVPVGIYDMDRIDGELELRPSMEGEIFRGIGGKEQMIGKGMPVLADDSGLIHLYPHRDCTRTMVTQRCKRALIVACGVSGMKRNSTAIALEEVFHYWDQLKE